MRSILLILIFSSSIAYGFSADSTDNKKRLSEKQLDALLGTWFSDSSGWLIQFLPDSINASVLMKTSASPVLSYYFKKATPVFLGKTYLLSTCQDSSIACFNYIISGTWGQNEFNSFKVISLDQDSMTIEITRGTDYISRKTHMDIFKRKL